jgi:hypothetical protein
MIGNVDFGSISNSSSAQTGYEDFTNISINVSQGSIYHYNSILGKESLKKVMPFGFFNSDGDFDDAGEQVWTGTTSSVSGTFSIPASATIGATRMRVSMKYNETPTSCELFPYGQRTIQLI